MNINFIDSDSNVFTIKYQVGQDQTGYQVGNTLPLEGTQSHRVMLTGQSLVRDDISSDSCFPSDSRMAELGFRSNIVVPLITKGRVIASLSLRSKEVGAYGNREKVILERLAKQIAPAIENAELYRQLQASTEEMEVVNEVARIMTSTLQIDQVCEEFAREMRKLVDFDRASISTVDREAGTYTPQYIFGDPKLNQPIGSVNPLPGTMTGKIEETRRTLVRGDISSPENGEFSDDQAHWEFGLRSCIALPLFSKGQVIGSMLLRSRKTNCYGPREQALLERLVRQIAPAIENARLYDQARGEKELATTTLAQLKGVLSGVDSGLLFVDNNRDTLWANHRYGEFFGIDDVESLATTHRRQADRRETLHKTFADPGRVFDERMRIYAEATFAGPTEEVELVYPARRILQPFTTPVYDESGESLGRLWVYHDITQSKAAEAQLLQFQKMESIGRLAGGIAHDFNNLLTAIMGYSQLAIMEAPSNGFLCSHIEEIQRAAERASNLTSQLLAFSRRQVVAPKVINLNDLILNLERLLRRLISEDIELVTLPSPDTGPIKIDPNQMEQVLVNLVVNARDAMPSGGKLVIETSNVNVGPQFTQQYLGVATGRYVMLSVSDNGVGMSEEVKAHLFEPFFTTKEVGKGTGLGLATCYGIVKQSGGYIEAVSEPGTGSSIKVYLPCSEEAPTSYPRNDQATPSTGGTETVLLAEDDPLVRSMVANVLTDQGYTVLQASNGDEALRLAQEQGHRRIDLLLSDIVMPQMGGVELARRISNLRPQTKIILTSGYSDEPIFRNGTLDSKIEFIQKPFIPAALASKVRDVLDRDN
jgi:signal transduction histidine kinase